ncbi:hypothetical protein DRO33_06000 [Candidatus Bathyarchaeota archaeon]|nr:MAG: hypothetical protein DRO33_06000 [Candidatus Bathyarchaeota archaeon]
MGPGQLVAVDEAVCSRLAPRVARIKVRMGPPAGLLARLDRETALRVLFFFMAVNYDTRGLRGCIRGRCYRWSDFLLQLFLHLAEEDPGALDPSNLAELTLEEFMSWFGRAGDSNLPRRPGERVALLRDAARKLLERYGGSVSRLLEACEGRLAGPGGLRERLAEMKAFDDPLAKKTMVFAILARLEGLWEPLDPENITVGVDYHLQRIALRTGMVKVLSPILRRKLVMRRFVSSGEHMALREACLRAYLSLGRASGLSQVEVDQLFWHLGRSCCHVRWPSCAHGGPCWMSEECTLIQATDYSCNGRCPLDGACEASLDPDLLKLVEPKVITYYY